MIITKCLMIMSMMIMTIRWHKRICTAQEASLGFSEADHLECGSPTSESLTGASAVASLASILLRKTALHCEAEPCQICDGIILIYWTGFDGSGHEWSNWEDFEKTWLEGCNPDRIV